MPTSEFPGVTGLPFTYQGPQIGSGERRAHLGQGNEKDIFGFLQASSLC